MTDLDDIDLRLGRLEKVLAPTHARGSSEGAGGERNGSEPGEAQS